MCQESYDCNLTMNLVACNQNKTIYEPWVPAREVNSLSFCILSCRYDHMAKNASTMQDDSLSTDAYLNVLYMPSFIKSERSRSTSDDPLDNFATISAQGGEEGVRSNLDRYRYEECIFYLQEVFFLSLSLSLSRRTHTYPHTNLFRYIESYPILCNKK